MGSRCKISKLPYLEGGFAIVVSLEVIKPLVDTFYLAEIV
jgi:hypothetical protein